MPPLTISIVVPVYAGGINFHHCLRSIARLNPPPNEIIVVTDTDLDGSGDLARLYGAKVIENSHRVGEGASRNRGAREVTSDIILFVDADVQLLPDTILKFRKFFEAFPEVSAAFGSYDDKPTQGGFFSQYKNLLNHYTHQTAKEDASTFWTALGAVRRERFLKLNGFFEHSNNGTVVSDIHFGYRLVEEGDQIRVLKSVQAKHLKRWTLASLVRADIFFRGIPWTEMIWGVRGRFIRDLNLTYSNRFSVVVAWLMVMAFLLSPNNPLALAAIPVLSISILALNFGLWTFFWRKRGLWFSLRAMAWHSVFHFYSGVAFIIGTIRFFMGRHSMRKAAAMLE